MRNCDLFDTSMHHDAHEFLNYLLNQVGEDLVGLHAKGAKKTNGGSHESTAPAAAPPTYVHELFQGLLTNETQCLTCKTVRAPF